MDVESLHHIPIHEKFQDRNRKFLSDAVPLEKLKIWHENCQDAHDSLVKDLIELTEEIKFIKTGTVNEEHFGLEFDTSYSKKIDAVSEINQKIQDRTVILARDEQKVASVIQDIKNKRGQSEEKNTAIQYLYDIHEKQYIPELLESYHSIRNAYIEIGSQKVFRILNI